MTTGSKEYVKHMLLPDGELAFIGYACAASLECASHSRIGQSLHQVNMELLNLWFEMHASVAAANCNIMFYRKERNACVRELSSILLFDLVGVNSIAYPILVAVRECFSRQQTFTNAFGIVENPTRILW